MDSKSTAKRFHNNSCIFHIMIHSRNVFITLDANLSVENALILCHNTCFVGVSCTSKNYNQEKHVSSTSVLCIVLGKVG